MAPAVPGRLIRGGPAEETWLYQTTDDKTRRREFVRCGTCDLMFVPRTYHLSRQAEMARYPTHICFYSMRTMSWIGKRYSWDVVSPRRNVVIFLKPRAQP